jgi:hypothetical protein
VRVAKKKQSLSGLEVWRRCDYDNVKANDVFRKGVARAKPGDSGDGICATLLGKNMI